ncbi:unannotated protein [freshwater metagenome]|uniref:Unannotated protein n=1 Tax=freshwater metagenome TaxID=449393 RepID=A0A6J6BEQ8_9ZZZZ
MNPKVGTVGTTLTGILNVDEKVPVSLKENLFEALTKKVVPPDWPSVSELMNSTEISTFAASPGWKSIFQLSSPFRMMLEAASYQR